MHYMWLGFLGGVLAFAHCLGMCGGFALHLSQGPTRLGVLQRQLLWHAGKTATYVFLGAMAGFLGHRIGAMGNLPWLQHVLTYIVGGFMIVMGLAMLGVIPARLTAPSTGTNDGFFASLFRQFFRETTPQAAFVLGLATGFLPCPIVLGFLALSVQNGSVPTGMMTMAAMGIGTVWALLLLGMTGQAISLRLRRWSPVLAGAVLIVLGAATAARGTEAFHRLLGCPHAARAAAKSPCCDHSAGAKPAADNKTPNCNERKHETNHETLLD